MLDKEVGFFEDVSFYENFVIARALDEITSMKILSHIEGDVTKIDNLLERFTTTVTEQLKAVSGKDYSAKKDEARPIRSIPCRWLNWQR